MAELDSAIVAEYGRFKTPADRIVTDPALATQFTANVNKALPKQLRVDVATLSSRLLNLRRLGQAKGGLPRLERDYKGRKPR